MSDLRESDAEAAAEQILLSADRLSEFSQVANNDLDPDVLHYLLGNYLYPYFATEYLPHYFDEDFCPKLHTPMFRKLRAVETHTTTRPTILAGFPECGKTTCAALLMPLHNICYGHQVYLPDGRVKDLTKRCILFVSSIEENAQKLLAPVLRELEVNEALHRDFGNLYHDPEAVRAMQEQGKQWNRKAATTNNHIHMMARGRNSSFRSVKWGNYRPDLGIVDDVEKDDEETSKTQRKRMMDWFIGVFLNRFSVKNGNVVVTGNLTHPFSMMNALVEYGSEHGWNVEVFRAYHIDKTTGTKTYLWPEKFGPEWERAKRDELMGKEYMFDREYLQDVEIVNPDLTIADIGYYDPNYLATRLPYCEIFLAMDPAATTKDRADFSCIMAGALDRTTGITYLLPSRRGHWGIHEQIAAFLGRCVELWHPQRIPHAGVESVAYQNVLRPLMEDALRKAGLSTLAVDDIQQGNTKKMTRIRRLFPDVKASNLKFLVNDEGHQQAIEQLLVIAKGGEPDNDDDADALEMMIRLKDKWVTENWRPFSTISAEIATKKSA